MSMLIMVLSKFSPKFSKTKLKYYNPEQQLKTELQNELPTLLIS